MVYNGNWTERNHWSIVYDCARWKLMGMLKKKQPLSSLLLCGLLMSLAERLSLEFQIFFGSFTNSQPNIDFFGHSQTLKLSVDIPASQKGFNVLNNLKFISVAPICFLHSPFTNDHCYWFIYIWLSLLFRGNTATAKKKKGCSLFHSINFAYCL